MNGKYSIAKGHFPTPDAVTWVLLACMRVRLVTPRCPWLTAWLAGRHISQQMSAAFVSMSDDGMCIGTHRYLPINGAGDQSSGAAGDAAGSRSEAGHAGAPLHSDTSYVFALNSHPGLSSVVP